MIKFIKKIFLLILVLFSFFSIFVFAVRVDIPWQVDNSTITSSTITSETDNYWLDLIDKINQHLWFYIWGISMWWIIFGWIKLVISVWNPDSLKTANWIVINSLIWLLVSIFSYWIIKMLINLF